MRFPKQELDIDAYFDEIKQLLVDPTCHIFIDTNIISQLYRLNENARIDFYNWVDSCNLRFHIPSWSVHEYSKRVTTQNTRDYLTELTKSKTCVKELQNIGNFIKAFVGDSLLTGSIYAGRKQDLFDDMDHVSSEFEKIANAINIGLTQHQLNVHKEVLDKLETYILESDIYSILDNLTFGSDLRFDGKVPPGFKDSDKETNRIGDLVIWKEILEFCKAHNSESKKIKAILISRDIKPDMVYRPVKQRRNGHNVNEKEKLEIAHESLVGEFKLCTDSEDYYLISFYTLVQILALEYRNLAISFQIATGPENLSNDTAVDEDAIQEIQLPESTDDNIEELVTRTTEDAVPTAAVLVEPYSEYALEDEQYDTSRDVWKINNCIDELKSYNWYKQNAAIDRLAFGNQSIPVENEKIIRDALFVLGRNILQSAEGASSSAIHMVETLHLKQWHESVKRAVIDGCLFEIFFDSKGKIRKKGFKATYINEIITSINKMGLVNPYTFINDQLSNKNEGRFVPQVGSSDIYTFDFDIEVISPDDPIYMDFKTKSLKINDMDVSDTFKKDYGNPFCSLDNLSFSLSTYYGIPYDKIAIIPLDKKIVLIKYIREFE